MKKQDIEKGRVYAVEPPGVEEGRKSPYGDAPWKVTAEAVEVGVAREHSKRLDGVRVRLCEEFRRTHGLQHDQVEVVPAGFEYVVSTAEVERPVTPADEEQIVVERLRRYALRRQVMAALQALGVTVNAEKYSSYFEARVNAEEVRFSVEFFARWIARIDPVENALQLAKFVDDRRPLDEDEYRDALSQGVEEMRQGLRVTEAELTAEPATIEPF